MAAQYIHLTLIMFSPINFRIQVIHSYFCVFLLTIAITASVTIVSSAQHSDKIESKELSDSLQSRFEIGIAGGLSLNQFTKGQPHTSTNTGYAAGLSINYKLYKDISLQLEANSLQQGGRTVTFKDDTRIGLPESLETKNVKNSSYAVNSIDIPLLVNYTFNIKQQWKPSVYVGGSYAYTYNVTGYYQKTGDLLPGEDIIATVSGKQNSTSSFKHSRANLIVGGSVKLPILQNYRCLSICDT